ncbi:MAG TPA: class I SAM-dependent methyltransferase [Ferrovibrio sp.]|uniref:class I SAM-dependent methyltransferase n=1 Tax=Ferrovibrio sp. TaxID=1917215 RepID=UPI002ED6AEDF
MERVEYHRMAALEDTMWWFRALHAAMIQRLGQWNLLAGAAILDAGCGTGGLLARLAAARPDFALFGLEFDTEAAALARKKARRQIAVGSVNAMPFAGGAFDAVVSADVLCHAGVDEAAALSEFFRCLKPGGRLLLNLPAYQWMASAHDRHVHNVRRYTAGGAVRLLAGAGFDGIRAGYWNSLLFPLMLLHRLAAGRGEGGSDVQAFPAWQDRTFFTVTAIERRLARGGIGLPFGGSVWISARKP